MAGGGVRRPDFSGSCGTADCYRAIWIQVIDPLVFLVVPAILLLGSFAASYIPPATGG
jgi:hypothetical protein